MADPITLLLPVVPTPKGRPRSSIIRGGRQQCPHCKGPLSVHVRTPDSVKLAELQIALLIGDLYQDHTLTGPLAMAVEFVFERPKAMFRKKDSDGRIVRTALPDLDHLETLLMDALQACRVCGAPMPKGKRGPCGCYDPMIADDAQIVSKYGVKWYGAILDRRARVAEEPHISLVISELAEMPQPPETPCDHCEINATCTAVAGEFEPRWKRCVKVPW